MVRAFTDGAVGRRIIPSWWTHQAISHSSHCSTTGLTKDVVCASLSGMVCITEPLLLIEKSSPCGSSGFSLSLFEWSFTTCLMPYNRKYNVLSALLNKTLPSLPFNETIILSCSCCSALETTITRGRFWVLFTFFAGLHSLD